MPAGRMEVSSIVPAFTRASPQSSRRAAPTHFGLSGPRIALFRGSERMRRSSRDTRGNLCHANFSEASRMKRPIRREATGAENRKKTGRGLASRGIVPTRVRVRPTRRSGLPLPAPDPLGRPRRNPHASEGQWLFVEEVLSLCPRHRSFSQRFSSLPRWASPPPSWLRPSLVSPPSSS